MKSTFPSEIEIKDSKIYTFGGLILVQLKRKSSENRFNGVINMKYSDVFGK